MIPYKSSLATAVPKTLEARLEILKAAHALTKGEDRFRERQREIASIKRDFQKIIRDFQKLIYELPSLVSQELRKHGYDPDEPRVPKRKEGAGEWTRVAADNDPDTASDAAPFPYQPRARGHHWVPEGVYKKRAFSEETKKVFDTWTSNALADPKVNNWSTEHSNYNIAVDELLDAYLKGHKISEEEMTPDQAREFVAEVLNSDDPRIREFRSKIQRERWRYIRVYGLRRGGGDEE